MTDNNTIHFNLDPHKTPVYFVDSTVIASNEQSFSFSFAQAVLDGKQQTIISRVAMSVPQAKQLLKDLNDQIERFER